MVMTHKYFTGQPPRREVGKHDNMFRKDFFFRDGPSMIMKLMIMMIIRTLMIMMIIITLMIMMIIVTSSGRSSCRATPSAG